MTETPTKEYLTDCNHVFALFIKQAMNKSITLNMDELLYYGIQICTFFVILYLLVPAKLIWCLFVILLVIMFVIYIVGRIYSVGFGKKINEKQKFDPEKIAKLSKLLET